MGIAVEFLPVGDSNGDAILVKYGDTNGFYLHAVDAGYTEVGELMIEHIERYYGRDVVIRNMVVSHADNDHATGLIPVLNRFKIAALWMHRPWFYASEVIDHFHGNFTLQGWIDYVRDAHEYLVELEAIAASRKIPINAPFQGQWIGRFLVLAPSIERYISLIPDLDKTPPPYREEAAACHSYAAVALDLLERVKETFDIETLDPNPPETSASNETCVVQLGMYDNRKILLTADVGPEGLMEAARYAQACGLLSAPDLVQIPHQGSRRNVTPGVLNAWLGTQNGGGFRGHAFVSVGANKNDHPRKKVKNAFIRRGYSVYVGRTEWIQQPFDGYDRRPDSVDLTPELFSPDVED
jgi:beta-lactamase superfamily II metal-dependent hydrolase